MENTLLGAYSSSRARPGYLGLLRYSVFGFIKEYQANPIVLAISIADEWPIFSTLSPSEEMNKGHAKFNVESFDALADAQYMAGPDLQVWYSNEGSTPFYLTLYSEAPEADKELIGTLGLDLLNKLDAYFGFTPMPHYVMHLEYLIPLSENHGYGFWMEHMNSMTGFSDTSNVISKENFRALSIAHHMAHSWVPLRSYGEGYRPFTWEVAPLIETIWFNEGFIWYAAGHEVLRQDRLIPYFNNVIDDAPDYISKLSLKELSLLGSTQYGQDFRIGRNLFSRGGLFAHELNQFIQKESGGKKSFKDAILAVYDWSQINQRAFKYDELPTIISEGIGLDITHIWEKWNRPIANDQ
jgi:predicted metalloprotease with PDZ domain